MSNKQDEQGIHYHYHFYGTGPGAQAGQQQGADAQQGDPQGGGFGPNPFAGGPFPGGAGSAGANLHAHPGADSFVKGLLIGAGAAWLLTNEAAQRTIMRTAVQLWTAVQGGVEELKEKLHDAEAEVAAAATAGPEAGAAAATRTPDAGAAGIGAAPEPAQEPARQPADSDPSVIAPRFFQAGN
ncbi:hypothetical protein FHS82_002863 [Pseudochelatococcus lubricantis]|uniref:YtxH domain-containing protein n=1 Tax=Pseudochelatococcus lubricantis TaxID=1538102 RepID=A0ABX0V352_9HYPH|nr:hypothetical protein [Pseudochelatococcus lubricantis]NIJ59008.1 hypothetical protein [Pseudochelatococcus lubricantis]